MQFFIYRIKNSSHRTDRLFPDHAERRNRGRARKSVGRVDHSGRITFRRIRWPDPVCPDSWQDVRHLEGQWSVESLSWWRGRSDRKRTRIRWRSVDPREQRIWGRQRSRPRWRCRRWWQRQRWRRCWGLVIIIFEKSLLAFLLTRQWCRCLKLI